MDKYTVVVLYPQGGEDGMMTYTALVEAKTPKEAERAGARQARSKEGGKLYDWTPLVTFPGHVAPVAWAWQTPIWGRK